MSMVVFSGLRCRKCGTRVAVAVAPAGRRFTCPTCKSPMRAERRVKVVAAVAWCPRCWVAPSELGAKVCPHCGRRLEPMPLPFPRTPEHVGAG